MIRAVRAWLADEAPVRVDPRQPVEGVTTTRGAVTIEGRVDTDHAARCVAAWWARQEADGLTVKEVA